MRFSAWCSFAGVFEVEKGRQADARRLAAERRKEQAAFYVPINVYMHSLLFSLYSFIGSNDTGSPEWTSPDEAVSEAAHFWVWASEDGLLQLGAERKHVSRGRPCAVSYELPADLRERICADLDGPLAQD